MHSGEPRAYIGITDWDWFDLLRIQRSLDEVNFWQPGGTRQFRALDPGELFLFKLHSPHNYIVGGGIFAHSTLLPISLAWEAFGVGNGAAGLQDMRARVQRYRRQTAHQHQDYPIGCVLLGKPFFLPEDRWIHIPPDWSPNIVQGRRYDLMAETGLAILQGLKGFLPNDSEAREKKERYGKGFLARPRLGQGGFRVVVTDAYDRRCAITGERTLPALDAAHIKPYSDSGDHSIDNGLLLRRDLHALFDRGYLTVTPALRVEVSSRIREEFENGRDYYRFQGGAIRTPENPANHPLSIYLEWHNNNLFRG